MSQLPARDAFDIPADVAYLNCAYMGPLPRTALAAGRDGLERKARPWGITVPDFFDPLERARTLFADLIGGDADGVCVIPSVSYATALAASNLPIAAGQRIVVLDQQFPSNVYVWRDLAGRSGAEVRTVASPADQDWTTAVEDAIDETVAIVAMPACHWTDGSVVDLVRVGKRARAVGAALVVDAAQAGGAVRFDVRELQPDFFICPTYKWMLGPYSLAFCWVAPERRQGRPLEYNWFTRAGSDDFAGLVDYTDELAPGARRYDVGEVSNFTLLPVAIASLEFLARWSSDDVTAHSQRLTNAISDGAAELGYGVVPPEFRSPHLQGLRLPGGLDPARVAVHLREQQVHVSVRGTSVRVSAHVFNDDDDVERLLSALSGVPS